MLCRARHASCLLAGMKNRPEDIPLFCLTLPSFPPDRGKYSVRGYPPFRGRTRGRSVGRRRRLEPSGLQFFHVVYVVVDAEDGDTHLSAVAGRVGADDAAVAGCGDGRVLDDGERLGGCVGFRHVELEVALAVTLHLDVDFGRTVAPHECLGLAEQGQRVALLAVEVDAVFLAAHLEVIAVDVSREVGRVGHEVDA